MMPTAWLSLAAIAAGAVLGAWSRYALSIWLNDRSWMPWGTFAANAIGALLIGLALGWIATRSEVSPLLKLFLVTGFLGALTTFSTYSAEVINLMLAGQWGRALIVAAAHLLGSLTLTGLGFWLGRALQSACSA
jgi:camphor resistance protein CrcB